MKTLPADRAPRVVLVTGGREWQDVPAERAEVYRILNKAREKYGLDAVLHGDAKGVDRLARDWARHRGFPEIAMAAPWTHYGKAAGPTRNEWMVRCISPDYCIAFPGGAGTLDMIERCEKRGIDVKRAKLAHPFYPEWKA